MADAARTVQANDAFDIARVRADFPILSTTVHGKPLVFLDSAASSLSRIPVSPPTTSRCFWRCCA